MANESSFIIHIGPPKTGTTTLQFNLFAKHPDIRYLGKPYWDEAVGYDMSKSTASLLESICQHSAYFFDLNNAYKLYDHGIKPRLNEKPVTVLSEEALSLAGAADPLLICQRLQSIFGKVRILITIREQKSVLFSGYRWLATRDLFTGSSDDWINWMRSFNYYHGQQNDFHLRQYLYSPLVSCYQDTFGKENVLVIPLEWLKGNLDLFAKTLSEFAGIDTKKCADFLSEEPRHNVSFGRFGSGYQRILKKMGRLRKRVDPSYDYRPWGTFEEGVHGRVMELISYIDTPPRYFSPESMKFINEYYAEDNLSLSTLTGLDLKSAGYTLPSPK